MKIFIYSAVYAFLSLFPGIDCDSEFQRLTIHKAAFIVAVFGKPGGSDVVATGLILTPYYLIIPSEYCADK